MMALIRSILKDAPRRGWTDSVPSIRIKEADGADDYRWLTQSEAVRLHDELAPHLRPPYLFALATGWREQNVLRLTWDQVDLDRRVAWINGRQAKAKKAIGAPLNRNAMDILLEEREEGGREPVGIPEWIGESQCTVRPGKQHRLVRRSAPREGGPTGVARPAAYVGKLARHGRPTRAAGTMQHRH